jgi:hypothetical protein
MCQEPLRGLAGSIDFSRLQMAEKKNLSYALNPRLRILRGEAIVLGPGKTDLLEAVAARGELRGANRSDSPRGLSPGPPRRLRMAGT